MSSAVTSSARINRKPSKFLADNKVAVVKKSPTTKTLLGKGLPKKSATRPKQTFVFGTPTSKFSANTTSPEIIRKDRAFLKAACLTPLLSPFL
jgi:hypothetical protein